MQKPFKNSGSSARRSAWCRQLIALICTQLLWLGFTIQAQISLNVTNFGAIGDAVQFCVNTVSNSVIVTTTNQLSSADIGKTIEVFGGGLQTTGVDSYGNSTNGNQDLIAVITNVLSGTNIYLSVLPQNTLTNTFATYGHDNRTSFSNAVAAAGGVANAIINIPAGKYLIMGRYTPEVYGYCGIVIHGGGIHLVGAGENATTLLDQGAWISDTNHSYYGYNVWRSFLLAVVPPVTNDYPFSIENLTMDGGVRYGNTPIHGDYANNVDGQGWDVTHDAIVFRGGNGGVFTRDTWTNVAFLHWRGEIVKSNDQSTNGNLTIVNCVFGDGNATAFNVYPVLTITNCLFTNLFQIAEYYQAYSTNTSYFVNNYVTNITANGFALNGGKGNNPPFIIQGNTFYFPGWGYNGIETTPGDNVFIVSNNFAFVQNGGYAIVLGCAGYQGTFDNSNIVVTGNSFSNASQIVQINGGMSSTDPNRVESVQIYGNSINDGSTAPIAVLSYGWSTNVFCFSNSVAPVADPGNGQFRAFFSSGAFGAQYAVVGTNNSYYAPIYDLIGVTNYISYGKGSRFEVIYPFYSGTVYALSDLDSSQIPAGAQMCIYNNNLSAASIPVYLNSALTVGPVSIGAGQTLVAMWNGAQWTTNGVASGLPTMAVTPTSLPFGTILTGTSVTNSFTVQNVGTANLSGSATVAAPFSILSGGSYNLGTNQSQTVTVVFSPSAAGNYSQSVTLTGGGGANVTVSGIATNAPVPIPIIQVAPSSLSYGTILTGTSVTNSFTVQNVGTATLSGSATAVAPFSVLSGGSYSLGTNQSQTVTVVFSPSAAGNYSQSVTLTGGNGTNVTVSGIATNAPVPIPIIQVAPSSLTYGTVLTGTSVTNSFTVQNVGTATLSGSAAVAAPFSILSGGSYSLGTNQSQTVTVVFSPSAAGNYNQSVTLTGGGGTNVTVTGITTNAPTSIIKVTPGNTAFGAFMSGKSKTNSFTVKNTGGGILNGAASVVAPFWILSGGSYSLATNQSQTVKVVFSPGVSGIYTQSMSFSGGGGTNVTVSGTGTNAVGVPPTISVISPNVPNLATNPAVLETLPGAVVQLSASASATNGNAMTWQWLNSTNGVTQVVYQTGSGTAPTTSFTNSVSTNGLPVTWTLRVTDTRTGLSAQTQQTVSIPPSPPPGTIQIQSP